MKQVRVAAMAALTLFVTGQADAALNVPAFRDQHLKGADDAATRGKLLDALRQHFRPEFLNRVDEIVIFHTLDRSQLAAIVDIQLERLLKRLAERRIVLRMSGEAREFLAERGYDPVYGARPLKRAIQRDLETPLSRAIIAGEVRDDSVVDVLVGDGALRFVTEPQPVATETATSG